MRHRILTTGAAGDIGLGIIRILKKWKKDWVFFGSDIENFNSSKVYMDYFTNSPRADGENYISWLSNFIIENKISILIPTSEAEIKVISKNIEIFRSTKVLINNSTIVQNFLDKNLTLSILGELNITVPEHGIVSLAKPKKYPVFIKPITGQGSKDCHVIYDGPSLEKFDSSYVWQEYLEPQKEEYTCPIFSSSNGQIRYLVMKRKLENGFTKEGIVVDDGMINSYVEEIAKKINFIGCINIQLRKTNKGPLLFEINPRISSTVVFRDKMGFTDLKWWIMDLLELQIPKYTKPRTGLKFYRGIKEYIY